MNGRRVPSRPRSIEVQVVDQPQRIEAGQAALEALLPVQPPEVHAHRFVGMVQQTQVGAGEGGIADVEGHRLARGGIDVQGARHGLVLGLVGVDALRRVQVQPDLQPPLMGEIQERAGSGEQGLVPGVAGPAGGVVAGFGEVPVHVQDADREGQLVGLEIPDQVGQLILAVGPVAAPPVAQRPARDHGHPAADPAVIAQAGRVIVPVAEEIEVRPGVRARLEPAVVVEEQGARIVDHGPARARHQARLEGDVAVGIIQGTGRAAQIGRVLRAGVPHRAAGLEGDRQVVRREARPGAGVVAQVQGLGFDFQAVIRLAGGEGRDGLPAEPEGLAGAIREVAVGLGFQADQTVRQDREACLAAFHDGVRAGGWRERQLEVCGNDRHVRVSPRR